jgi:methylaspartate ammonia-lyase
MAHISNIITIPTEGPDFILDQAALQTKAIAFSKRLRTRGQTPSYTYVSEPAETLSVGLVLDDGNVAWGECAAPVFSFIAGRDPVFRSSFAQEMIHKAVKPVLIGRNIDQFRVLLDDLEMILVDDIQEQVLPQHQPGEKISRREMFKSVSRLGSSSSTTEIIEIQRNLRSAILYGVSQAILQAAAMQDQRTITEIICREWDLPLPTRMIPIQAQGGNDWYLDAERMIIQGVASLPHFRIENIPEQIGKGGVQLIKYIRWLKNRIQRLGPKDYHPVIHLTLQGALGNIFQNDLGKILGVVSALERATNPYMLRIESPLVMETREEQIQVFKQLREFISFRKMTTQIVVCEWANTADDVQAFIDAEAADMFHLHLPVMGSLLEVIKACLICKSNQVGILIGGSSTETDLSARISSQVALALQPDFILAKPGLSVAEGISIVSNQMRRTLRQIELQKPGG